MVPAFPNGARSADEITRKLRAWREGDESALDQLLPFVLANMRAIARRLPSKGETLNTTSLVNETWVRLSTMKSEPGDREHFFALISRAMRQILIDHARGRKRLKRGGGMAPVPLEDDLHLDDSRIEELLIIDDLLTRLELEHPRRRQIFEMRFFGGFTVDELSHTLDVSANTVIRDYRLACAWLRFHFNRGVAAGGAEA